MKKAQPPVGIEPTTSRSRGEYSNRCATTAAQVLTKSSTIPVHRFRCLWTARGRRSAAASPAAKSPQMNPLTSCSASAVATSGGSWRSPAESRRTSYPGNMRRTWRALSDSNGMLDGSMSDEIQVKFWLIKLILSCWKNAPGNHPVPVTPSKTDWAPKLSDDCWVQFQTIQLTWDDNSQRYLSVIARFAATVKHKFLEFSIHGTVFFFWIPIKGTN